MNASFYVSRNVIIHVKRYFKNNKTISGTIHQSFALNDSVKYITDVYADYKKVSGKNQLIGKIAELGPGDSDGVAFMFLAHGAAHVDLADRFYSLREPAQQNAIKRKLFELYPSLNAICNLDSRCVRHYGEPASGESFFDHKKGYDFIVSRSVLEHVDNPEIVLRKMFNALNHAGMLIHKVDLRDHGMFTPFTHPLKFLEIPTNLYRSMTHGSGYPNRFLFHRYREVLCTLDPAVKFYVAGLHGVDAFNEIYPIDEIPLDLKHKAIAYVNDKKSGFSREFKHVASNDVIISSFFIVCTKV